MTATFHKRDTLGLGAPNPGRLTARTAAEMSDHQEGITWHWTADGGALYRPDPVERLRAIWDFHVHGKGYGDIAYHGAYDAGGNCYELRDSRWVGAHALSTDNEANRCTAGIVFLEDHRGYTNEALEAFAWWRGVFQFAQRRAPIDFAHEYWAKGHGGTPTACPGPDQVHVLRWVGGRT